MSIFDYVKSNNMRHTSPEPEGEMTSSHKKSDSIFKYARSIGIPKEESLGEAIPRHLGRSVLALNEMAYGLPGDVFSRFLDPVQKHAESVLETVSGKTIPEDIKKKVSQRNKNLLPTSGELKQRNIKLFPEIRTPRSQTEEKFDRGIQDAASHILSGGTNSLLRNTMRAVGIVGAGEAAGETAKQFGFSEDAQDTARNATMFGASLINPGGAAKYSSELRKEANRLMPAGATGNAAILQRDLTNLRTKLSKGTVSAAQKAVIDEIDAILGKVRNGRIGYDEVVASKTSGNDKVREFIYSTPDRIAKAGARKLFKTINRSLDDVLKQAKNTHPQFYKAQRIADETYGAIQGARAAQDFLIRHAGKTLVTGAAYPISQLFLHGPLAGALAAGHVGVGIAGLKGYELGARIARSPTLRRYYGNVLIDAGRQNAESMNRNINKLKKGIQDDPNIMKLLQEEQ